MRFFSLTTTTSGSAFGNWPIIKQIAWVLGLLMQGIFIVLSGMGIRSVAACIIVFTVITKMLMLPLTIKQQKFTKVNALMTPEIQAIQKKYANKKDQASMAKMQLEQQQVYDKYGSSMSAGCLPSLIQFPILFALYPVIYDLEKYIPQLANYSESEVQAMYQFMGMDLASTPGLSFPGILIPILAALFSFLSSKLMMVNQPKMEDSPMGNSMKMMNYTMPIMSLVICFTLPTFLGLYWVVQSLVMIIQQWAINKHMEGISVEDIIKENIEKQNKKRAKKGLPPLNEKANINAKKLAQMEAKNKEEHDKKLADRDAKMKSSTDYYNAKAADPNSLAARANMVREFNERNSKKK